MIIVFHTKFATTRNTGYNTHDDRKSSNLEVRIVAQMQKSVEDLTAQNFALQVARILDVHVPNLEVPLRNPEYSHTPMIVFPCES
jgi:hypothetical protein